jgi:hypothetical protein
MFTAVDDRAAHRCAAAGMVLMMLVCGYAAFHYGLFRNLPSLPPASASRVIYSIVFWSLALFLRQISERPILWLAGALLAWMMIGIGIAQVVPVLLFIATAAVIGARLLRKADDAPDFLIDVAAGLSAIMGVCGILIHFPINTPELYLVAIAILLALNHRYLAQLWQQGRGAIGNVNAQAFWPIAVLLWVAGIAFASLFLPTVSYDDLSYHLLATTQLTLHHRFLFDFQRHLWALAPLAADLFYAIPQLLAGEDCRGALNGFYLIAIAALGNRMLVSMSVSTAVRAFTLALLVSMPMVHGLASTMQSETSMTFFAFAGLVVMTDERYRDPVRCAKAALLIAAVLLAIKTTAAFLALPLLLATGLRLQRVRRAGWAGIDSALVAIAGLAMLVGFQSYAYSFAMTGNPVFPLFNQVFRSPYFDTINFFNPLFVGKLSWHLPLDMTFLSSSFAEAGNGTFGFQFLMLSPALVLIALGWRSRAGTIAILALAAVYMVPVVISQQYIRYLFPGLAMVSIALGIAAQQCSIGPAYLRRTWNVAWGIALLGNIYFMPFAGWHLESGSIDKFTVAAKQAYLAAFAPDRLANDYINRTAGKDAVVFYDNDRPFGAGLEGTPLYPTLYNMDVVRRLVTIDNAADLASFFKDYRITHYVRNTGFDWPHFGSGRIAEYLAELVSRTMRPVFASGRLVVYRVDRAKLTGRGPLIRDFSADDKAWSRRGSPAWLSAGTVRVNQDNYYFQSFADPQATVLRLRATVRCAQAGAAFIAHVNWYGKDSLAPYYRVVPCAGRRGMVAVDEAILVPSGSERGEIYIETRDAREALVSDIGLEPAK